MRRGNPTQVVAASLATLVALTAGRGVAAQDSSTERKSALERFRALHPDERSSIARGLRRQLQRDADPDLQRLLDYGLRFKTLPRAKAPVAYRAEDWAKGVAPTRKLLGPKDPQWQRVAKRFPEVPVLPRLKRHVQYAWDRGIVERSADERITDDEIFENLLAGYAPGSGDAFVSVLQILDKASANPTNGDDGLAKGRAVARWAAHLYADLDARSYTGITLWRAWHANDEVEVPDVDAIPFAQTVLGEKWTSPIPADARRARLYARIQSEMRQYRVRRELREAAAAAWIHSAPKLDKNLRRLVSRMHQVWAECDDDPRKMAKRLASIGDRDAFLEQLDAAAGKDAAVYERREARRRRLARLVTRLRDMARAAIPE